MGVQIPRVTLSFDTSNGHSLGELGLISLGYGLHYAWIYATMFSTTLVFGGEGFISSQGSGNLSLTFIISSIAYALCLLIYGLRDEKMNKLYSKQRTFIIATLLASIGSLLLLFPSSDIAAFGASIEVISGILTGVGTSTMILFWGIVYARQDLSSIVLNSSVAVVIGFVIYALVIRNAPSPANSLIVVALPLFELLVLRCTIHWPGRPGDTLGTFSPLPINKGKLAPMFLIPVFVLGISIGLLRHTSLQDILPAMSATDQFILVAAAACAALLVIITLLTLNNMGHWDMFFRALIPFFIAGCFLLLSSAENGNAFTTIFPLIEYLCFETLVVIFFGELSQRYRLSAVFIYGTGRSIFAIATLIGSLIAVYADNWIESFPTGEFGITILALLIMVIAYTLLPSEQAIRDVATSRPAIRQAEEDSCDDMANDHLGTLNQSHKSTEKSSDVQYIQKTSTSSGAVDESSDDKTSSTSVHVTDIPSSPDSKTTPDNDAQVVRPVSDNADIVPTQRSDARATSSQPAVNTAADSSQQAKDDDERHRRGPFRKKCDQVANTFLLSRREAEVLFLLAKGHNCAYIQEKLFISEGTAKTHIRHIYRKLDVHTQQDLMRLVEDIDTYALE